MQIPDTAFTHGGKFHADDVFSAALLKICNPNIAIQRGFAVPQGFAGLVFDIGDGPFDHHAKNSPVRENGVPYAAFGLLWRELGPQLVGPVDAGRFDESFVQPLDLDDNTGCGNQLANIIAAYNPRWDGEDRPDDCFAQAVALAQDMLAHKLEAIRSVQRAAAEVETTLGAIDVWINNAMTTVLAPFRQMSEEEFRRVTEVTYLGYVNGTRAALEVMIPRDRGVIIQAGSALAWRSIPLQSAYCGAKAAIRGFTDAVRTELMHEKSHIQLTMVQLPGMNTAQFGWARNKMDQAMQPVPPVYQPEVAAEAIYSVIQRPVNELWVGKSTIQSILGQVFFPRLLDRLMVKKAWEGQFTGQPKSSDQQDDLFTPVRGNHPGHGPFNDGARRKAVTISADLPGKVAAGVGVAVATMALRALFRRSGKRR